jgi:hypothetical protein
MNNKGDRPEVEDNEEQENKNVTHLWQPKLITGGKSPPGHNWLSDMKEGSVFLVKPKQSGGFALGQFHLLHKLDNAVHLMDNLQQGETHIWVDPVAFCAQFNRVAIIFEMEEDDSSEH